MAGLNDAGEVESTLQFIEVSKEIEEQDEASIAKLTAAQRARSERNRMRARALQDARLSALAPTAVRGIAALDSGGGFLLETERTAPTARPVSAPLIHRAQQPVCLECSNRFPQSTLFDQFEYAVCDECRDDQGEHALVTRTEAKNEFLLKDCDLDARPPPLRFLRRRNPHSTRYGDMRLYLLAQVRTRSLEVWGSEEALDAERARRREARVATRAARASRDLRALRLDVRPGLLARSRPHHEHEFGVEQYDEAADTYSRKCISCGHRETYEKM